jgi:hypothetical protein
MVSIAVAPQPDAPTPAAHKQDELRRSAIWYPDFPLASLDLNEASFPQLPSYTWGYRPLFWACFGGPGGMYLGCLTKITISWSFLRRMDFTFDREVPAECRTFGRWEDSEHTDLIQFPIDGPGGERIERVDIFQQYPSERERFQVEWYRAEGSLDSLKIYTNRGRACRFGDRPSSRKKIVRQKFLAAPGSVITGFFGAQVRIPPVSLLPTSDLWDISTALSPSLSPRWAF